MKKILVLIALVVSTIAVCVACRAVEGAAEDVMSVGETLVGDFDKFMENDLDIDSLSDKVFSNEIIPFEGKTTKVSAGELEGFGDTQITGFTNARKFSSGNSDTPFLGYIFELDEGTNADEFVNNLKNNADLNWNGRTKAEEITVRKSGNRVFFLMSPKQF